ncbi:hypothetical protein [Agrobacterium sp. Ap1]|uniref:hypothetical protein n=1 Tax=Agrobacterium sp. Ap1 TaxID=2815337 RepID=UPI001A8F30B6|nr:hypothetical protein [Agrobacterium sp. Ap1]
MRALPQLHQATPRKIYVMDTETITVACPPQVWTQVSDEHQSLFIQNQDAKALKLHFGNSEPEVNTSAFIVSQDYNPLERNFSFDPRSKVKLWIMPVKSEATQVVVVRTAIGSLIPENLAIKTVETATHLLTNEDWGILLSFTQGCKITVPNGLASHFYCTLRQSGADQIEVVPGEGATVEEIDGNFKSEKRLAVLALARIPLDGAFQLTGRTAA